MPTYEYQCESCGYVFEKFHGVNELVEKCPECGGPVKKRITAGAGLIFKGSGFYITDYKRSSGSNKENSKDKSKKSTHQNAKGDR